MDTGDQCALVAGWRNGDGAVAAIPRRTLIGAGVGLGAR